MKRPGEFPGLCVFDYQSEIKTVEVGPFQTIFHLLIISRPISRPKFCGDISISPEDLIWIGSLHELIGRLIKGESLEPGKVISTAKFGISTFPAAV